MNNSRSHYEGFGFCGHQPFGWLKQLANSNWQLAKAGDIGFFHLPIICKVRLNGLNAFEQLANSNWQLAKAGGIGFFYNRPFVGTP